MAPTIGRVALDNGFHGSIPGDWVAPPPQNIHISHDFFEISFDFVRFALIFTAKSHIIKMIQKKGGVVFDRNCDRI